MQLRRVEEFIVCSLITVIWGKDTPPTPLCTTGLFYYGSALDLEEFADHKGVMFQFRDTAVGEIGYEVLRRRADGARGERRFTSGCNVGL